MGGAKQKKKHAAQSQGNGTANKQRQTPNATESSQNGVGTKDKPSTSPAVQQHSATDAQPDPAALQSKVESVAAELKAVQNQNLRLKEELNQEMETSNELRAQLARSRQMSYVAIAAAAGATLLLAVKLQRPQ